MHELSRPLRAEEELQVQVRLMQMLQKRAALYTSGRGTSLREDTAKALLASIRFSLKLYFAEQEIPFTAILTQEMGELLAAAESSVRRAVRRARGQYVRACRCVFQNESLSLQSTLQSIGDFFRAYDSRFFAAECPCDIDYQLALPVPEDLQGVVYLRTYLDRLLTEDAFLRRLPPQSVRRVLAASEPEHRELLVNLYETAVMAALGVTLAEGDLFTLFLTSEEERRLTQRLAVLPSENCKRVLSRGADLLSCRLGLNGEGTAYLRRTAEHASPRIAAAAAAGSLTAVFPTL